MGNMNTEKLLAEANKIIKGPDVIIDPYDLTYVWVSKKICKIFEYSCDDIISKQLTEFEIYNKRQPREIEMEMIDSDKPIEINSFVKTKSGKKIRFMGEGQGFKFGGHPYLVGKIKKVIG